MTHPADDELIACALGELDGRDREAVRAHAAGCARCAGELDAIARVLAATSDTAVPERGGDYGARVWARLEPRLPAAAGGRHAARRWLMAAAVLLAVAGAFVLGRRSPAAPPAPADAHAAQPADPARVRERVVLAAVTDHLDRTERGLLEIVNAEPGGRVDISAERAWAEDLLAANRLYRQSARGAAPPVVADLLDELEPVLLELVHSPDHVTAREFESLRARIEDRSLVFKVRVAGDDLRARQRTLRRPGGPTS